jgi:hypothetical protein
MEIIKWHCVLGLLLQWLGPAGSQRTQPISTFRPMAKIGDLIPPFTGAALPADSGQPATRG